MSSLQSEFEYTKVYLEGIDMKSTKFERDMADTLSKVMDIKNNFDDVRLFRGRLEMVENEQR